MEEKESIEGNKLIADFIAKDSWMTPDKKYRVWEIHGIGDGKLYNILERDFKFHSSWDWLMPVLEKIKKVASKMYHDDLTEDFIVFEIDVWDNTITIIDEDTGTYPICSPIKKDNLIEAMYESVVEFIKWHNSITAVAVTPNEVQK